MTSPANSEQHFFGTKKVWKILLKIAPPVMLAQLIQALYNIVDSYYVGRDSAAGLTALSIIFPLQLLITAFSVGTGVGINTVMARFYGTKQPREADAVAGIGTVLALVSWLIFAVAAWFVMPAYVRLSTTTPEVIDAAIVYGRIVSVFSFGTFLESVWTKVLQASGNMRVPMIAQIIGALINVALDPILIFGLGPIPATGVAGAAIATVVGQIAAAVITAFRGFRPIPAPAQFRQYIPQIYRAAFPSITMQSLYTVYIVGLNMILSGFSDSAVTVLGLYYKLQTFFFIPLIGLQTCIVPVLSFNYAAGARERCSQVLWQSLLIAAAFMVVGVIGFVFFPIPLIRLFSGEAEVLEIGRIAFPLIGAGFLPAVPAWIFPVFFQAIGRNAKSVALIVLRQIVLLVPIAWALSFIGLSFVWLTFPISEIITSTLGVTLYLRWRKQEQQHP